jgi:hypothetical protein
MQGVHADIIHPKGSLFHTWLSNLESAQWGAFPFAMRSSEMGLGKIDHPRKQRRADDQLLHTYTSKIIHVRTRCQERRAEYFRYRC